VSRSGVLDLVLSLGPSQAAASTLLVLGHLYSKVPQQPQPG
jgi:hypothetical protein